MMVKLLDGTYYEGEHEVIVHRKGIIPNNLAVSQRLENYH